MDRLKDVETLNLKRLYRNAVSFFPSRIYEVNPELIRDKLFSSFRVSAVELTSAQKAQLLKE